MAGPDGAGAPEVVTGVAVVTGAARGIGAAVTRQLAAHGWAVVALDRCADDPALSYPLATRADLDATVRSCAAPERVLGMVADVRDQEKLSAAVATAVRRFGRLDAAVGVAGVLSGGGPLWETTDEQLRTMLDVDVVGVYRLARAAVPALLSSPPPRHGRFVAVASAAGSRGLPRLAAYCAAKHAVVGLVRGLAADLRGTGITANVVSPGSTDTELLAESARIYGLPAAGAFAGQHLLERLLTADEPAALITWLCSREASGLTGADVPVDAGLTV
jgi:SDR family mycofactocin-dependent oxidoreductase